MQTTHSTVFTVLVALLFLPAISAHFLLVSPPSRGFDDGKIATFPCGGFDTVQTSRSLFPLTNGEISLEMADKVSNLEVLIGLGNTVGNGFNQVIRQTFLQNGEGNFCMTGFNLPPSMNGMNATIQVVSSSEDGGGLYNCADATLSTLAKQSNATDACFNATGVTAGPSAIVGNPNITAKTGGRTVLTPSGSRERRLILFA